MREMLSLSPASARKATGTVQAVFPLAQRGDSVGIYWHKPKQAAAEVTKKWKAGP